MIPFVTLVFGALVFMVLWFTTRSARLSGAAERIDRLEQEVGRMRVRLTSLEQRSTEVLTETAPHDGRRPASPRVPDREASRVVEPLRRSVILPQPRTSVAVAPNPERISSVQPLESAISDATKMTFSVSVAGEATRETAVGAGESTSATRAISLEERLGQNWLNKLGIVTLVTGLALLLGYKLRTLGPVGKSFLGMLLSIAILAMGLVLERRERYRTFARAAIGGGWALLFFVTFALFHVPAMQVLHSQVADLLLMLAVAAAMVLHSLRYRSQVVTSLAFLLGFFTVAISHVTMFSLGAGAILAAGLVVVAFRERWFVLVLGGLVAVYLNHFLWLHRVLPYGALPGHSFPEFLPSAALLLFYWLLFRAFYILRIPETESDRVCSTTNALLNSAGLLMLLKYQSSHPEWASTGLLALGLVEFVFAFLARRRNHSAFVMLVCLASFFSLAAVPLLFAGSSWSMVWLLESEALFVAGLALRESVFRRLGVLSLFAALIHMLVGEALPVFELRQIRPDASHYVALTVTFGCAALVAWFNAEVATRRWTYVVDDLFDRNMVRAASYAAMVCAAVAAWIAFAGPWTVVLWLAAALMLAFAATRLGSEDLALQADLLSGAAVVRAALINFGQWGQSAHAPRTVILLASSALLYAQMLRRQRSHLLQQNAIEACYSWAAAAILGVLAWYALEPAAVGVAWCLVGAVLLEVGLAKRRTDLRQQGFVLLALSFLRMYFVNIALAPAPRLYTMLPLAAVYAWVYQRLFASEESNRAERIAGAGIAWLALGTVATLLYLSLRPAWVAVGGAMLAVAVLLLARVVRRPLFVAQAVAVIILTAVRTIAFNIFSTDSLSRFPEARTFSVSATSGILLLALPVAFSLRRQEWVVPEEHRWMRLVVRCPEQVLFFAALAILFVWIPAELRAGMITVGWGALACLRSFSRLQSASAASASGGLVCSL